MQLKFGLVLLGLVLGQCSQPKARKEIRELTDSELGDFQSAINQMHREFLPGRRGLSSYEYFSYIHLNNVQYAHSTPMFLPWHRQFIRQFELELQRFRPNVMLPYWDWSLDSYEPHRSPVLSSKYMGGNGALFGKCVQDGPFANWQMNFPNRHCLRRDYDLRRRLSSFSSPEAILLDINERRFSDFSLQFEIKHGRPHNSIGGRQGDLAPMYSPNDPLFFLHHAFVDLVWDKWQQKNPNSPYEGARHGSRANIDDTLPGLETSTVADVLDTTSDYFCYRYPDYPRPIFGPNTPRQLRNSANRLFSVSPFSSGELKNEDLDTALLRLPRLLRPSSQLSIASDESLGSLPLLKPPSNLTSDFVRNNRLNPVEVERAQQKEKDLVTKLNSLGRFRSLSSIQAIINDFM